MLTFHSQCNIRIYTYMYVQYCTYVIVIAQDEYDIFVITQVQGKAEDEC